MKTTWMIVLVLLLVVVVGYIGVNKVKTWADFGRANLVERIDNALGEYEIKRSEAEAGISGLEQSLRAIREGQIRCDVRSQQMQGTHAALQERMSQTQNDLRVIRGYITGGESVTLAGKSYTPAELQVFADRLIQAFSSMRTQAQGLLRTQALLDQTSANLNTQADQGHEQIAGMRSQLDEIDAKILALNTMREAAALAGSTDATLAANFEDVAGQINSLYADVEAGLRIEESDWQHAAMVPDAELARLIQGSQSVDDTLAEIDAILGE